MTRSRDMESFNGQFFYLIEMSNFRPDGRRYEGFWQNGK